MTDARALKARYERALEIIKFYAQEHPGYYYCCDYLDEGPVIEDKGRKAREFLKTL